MSRRPLSPEQWADAKRIFLRAAAFEGIERDEFITRACAGRTDLLAEVRSLLASELTAPEFLAAPERAMERMLTEHNAAPDRPLPGPGDTIGSCRLLSLIGEGATGLIFLAEQSRPRRKVAVKILRPGQASTPALRRLEREAEIMAGLRHRGIAQIVESGVDRAGPFFVMEYIEGETITAFARRRGLSINERLRLFLRVCDAVQHAHSMGVIHRDLKPANILVVPPGDAGGAGEPKILDFGVARALDADPRLCTVTLPMAQVVGTLAYMSPEQASGTGDAVDTRSDVYALGAILYELLGGRPPLEVTGLPLPQALARVESDHAARLGTLARECRGDLETIAAKALEKDRARRYASVSELAGDIRRHLERLPIHARPPSTIYEIRRFTARHRSLVATIGVALTATLGALGWSLVSRARAHQDFLIARSVAGSWLADVTKALGTTPGTFEARRRMIADVRGPLERLAERYPWDLEIQANIAALAFATGDIESEIRNLEEAIGHYTTAFRILSNVCAAGNARIDWRLQRSIAAVRVGDILIDLGRGDEAGVWHMGALAIDLGCVKDHPESYTANDQLVWSYDRLAFRAIRDGRHDEASRYAGMMDDAAMDIYSRWPDKPKALWCRVGALHTRAAVHDTSGRKDEAMQVRTEALRLGRVLIEMDSNRGYSERQAATLVGFARHELDQGGDDAAGAFLDEAAPLVHRAVILDPHVRMPHRTAISYFYCLRDFHLSRGEHRAALDAGAMTIHHAQELARLPSATRDDTVAALAHRLSQVHLLSSVGAAGDAEAAACDLRDAILDAASRFPAHPGPHELLAILSLTAPGAARDLGLALLAAERAVELSDPSEPSPLELLADVLKAIGDEHGASLAAERAAVRRGGLAVAARPAAIDPVRGVPADAPALNSAPEDAPSERR